MKEGAVRGRHVTIDAPTADDHAWIFNALQRRDIHVPLGARRPPTLDEHVHSIFETHRGDEVKAEFVRYHVLRDNSHGRPTGFFVDFGWDHANDVVREIDLAFPSTADRNVGVYFDATVIVAQYLFMNRLAKRVRWRVRSHSDRAPRRHERHGARLIKQQQERHPETGEWVTTFIFELAEADFQRLAAMERR
ncbi:MAG: hypothetical protein H7Z43_10685, partial [Clostridia bacterium]|nr:hypothetical protein [Deltaproteobacteria bacterium]